MEKRRITDENGNVYDVILTFHNDSTNKDYIIYNNNEFDNEEKLKIYSSKGIFIN